MAAIANGLRMRIGDYLAVAARMMGDPTFDASGRLIPPTEAEPLERAVRVTRRAFRRVVSEGDWIFLRQTVEITLDPAGGSGTFDGDASKYRMPWYFNGRDFSDWSYTGSTAPSLEIRTVPQAVMSDLRNGRQSVTGDPVAATYRKVAQGSNEASNPGWIVEFYPTPSAARTVSVTVRAYPDVFSDTDQELFAGDEYMRLFECATMLEAALENAPDQVAAMDAMWREALRVTLGLDRAMRPRFAGTLRANIPLLIDQEDDLNTHTYDGPITAHGVSIV